MSNSTFTNKAALKKLNKSWKQAALKKLLQVPKAQKIEHTPTWIAISFRILILSILVGLCSKISGADLSIEAHFAGLVLLYSIFGGLLLGASQAFFNSFIPPCLVNTPLSSELLLSAKKSTFYKACIVIITLFVALVCYFNSEHQSLNSSMLDGLLILIVSIALPFLLSFFINPFTIALSSAISLVILFIISFFPSLQEPLYSSLTSVVLYTPVGLVVSKTLPIWALLVIALTSLIIIHRYYQLLFTKFEIIREQQDVYYDSSEFDELESEDKFYESNTHHDSTHQVREEIVAASLKKYLVKSDKDQSGFLGHKFYQILSSREQSILCISNLKKLNLNFIKACSIIILAFIIKLIDRHLTYSIPDFFLIAPLVLTAIYCLNYNGVALDLLENHYSSYRIPKIAYYPVGYKEIIRLHLKEIVFASIWKFPILLLVLSLYRISNEEEKLLGFSHALFVMIFYLASQYLQVYRYRQSLGVRVLDITMLFVIVLSIFPCFVIFSLLCEGYHPEALYYSTLGVSIISALFAYIHYKSYYSSRLDIVHKIK